MDSDLLLSVLNSEIKELASEEPAVAVAYSGGLDSSIIEAVARGYTTTVCYVCSAEGGFDATNAQARAQADGCLCDIVLVSPEDLVDYVAHAARVMNTTDPIAIGYTVPILCVLNRSDERVILAGNGADELFGGYAKYLDDENPIQTMAQDLAKAQAEARRLKDAAESIGKQLVMPFLTDRIVEVAAAISFEDKIRAGSRKVILRQVAMDLGLKSHDRPKKASQYSSGIMKAMQRLAKEEGAPLREWTIGVAQRSRRIP